MKLPQLEYTKQYNLEKTVEILQPLGCMWKTEIFKNLHTSFMNKIPNYDVGEKAIVEALKNGYQIKNFRNTITQPETNKLVKDEKIRNWHVDKVLDEENNVIFMHLGRGLLRRNMEWREDRFRRLEKYLS